MREVLEFFAGHIFVFGYSVPRLAIFASGLLLLGFLLRSVSTSVLAGVLLVASYVLVAVAAV